MKRTAVLRKGKGVASVSRHVPPRRLSDEAWTYLSIKRGFDPMRLFAVFGLKDPMNPESPDWAAASALAAIGAALGKMKRAGEAQEAVMIPLGRMASGAVNSPDCGRSLNFGAGETRPADPLEAVADILAIPVSGGACAAMTGTASAGGFATDEKGRIRLYTDGMVWLRRWLKAVSRECGGLSPHASAAVVGDVPPPEDFGTLLIDANAFPWRAMEPALPVWRGAKEILCADSAALGAFLEKEIKARARIDVPVVRAPAQKNAVAA